MKSKIFWLGLAAIALIATLAALAVPNFGGSRTTAANVCANNLRQLDGAVQQWALDHHKVATDAVTFADIKPYLRTVMNCPQEGFYSIGPAVTNIPQCTIKGHHL